MSLIYIVSSELVSGSKLILGLIKDGYSESNFENKNHRIKQQINRNLTEILKGHSKLILFLLKKNEPDFKPDIEKRRDKKKKLCSRSI